MVAYLNHEIIKFNKRTVFYSYLVSPWGMYFSVYFKLHVLKRILCHMARFEEEEEEKNFTMALFS